MTIIATTLLPSYPSSCVGVAFTGGRLPVKVSSGISSAVAMPVIRLVDRPTNGTTNTRLLSRPDPPEG